MTHAPADPQSAPSPEQLREQVERPRHDLGQTVQALADKTDVKTRAQQKTGELKEQAIAKTDTLKARAAKATSQIHDKLPDSVKDQAAQTAGQVRARAAHAGRMWEEKAPEPLRQKAARSAQLARDHRTVLLVAAAGVTVLWVAGRRKKG
ncbi:DUF3618 domain-containing protein [Streptomyces sp. NPDC015532]|uniref:DUF3618 domain-containing protein n=1 Tax=Streptomyces sp. NPDC015532 TaxID=3364960 RepID=UPI00370310BB